MKEPAELSRLRRNGLPAPRLWKKILASPELREYWRNSQDHGELDLQIWRFLWSPSLRPYLERWEEIHPLEDLISSRWEDVLKFCPPSAQASAHFFIKKYIQNQPTEQYLLDSYPSQVSMQYLTTVTRNQSRCKRTFPRYRYHKEDRSWKCFRKTRYKIKPLENKAKSKPPEEEEQLKPTEADPQNIPYLSERGRESH